MRMRRKKNGEARLQAHAHLLCPLPAEPMADYAEIFGRSAPLYLEIGCGKGAFACGMAAANPDCSFLAWNAFMTLWSLLLRKRTLVPKHAPITFDS